MITNKANNFLGLLIFLTTACSTNHEQILQNCRKIEIGMSENDVIKIMGEPASKSQSKQVDNEVYYVYYYEMPAMASTGVDIYINSNTQKVTDVFCGEE